MAKEANKHDLRHKRNIAHYEGKIDKLYKDTIEEIVQMSRLIGQIDDSKPFDFADHPAMRKRFQRLLKEFQEAMEVNIIDGIEAEWNLANGKNDELVKQVLGRKASKLPLEQQQRYFNNHDTALEAFKRRKEGGLDLSTKVWNYTKQFKGEMEMALDIGLGEGRSAVELSRDLHKYLKHPDMLFRRVRDKHGVLHLSKRAENYHPGRGVYRSSYKNARRLVATETNMAYRTADHLRWQNLDFVVGIKISLSNNHTLLGADGKPHPFHDICDDLAGNYPKDFKFVGWHPHCRCFATPILKTLEELQADNKRILKGEEVSDGSENRVVDVPKQYKKWFDKNADRIEKSKKQGTLPFFLRDNVQYHKGEEVSIQQPSPLDIAKQRHEARTDEQVESIKLKAWDRQLKMNYPKITEDERKALTKNWLDIEKELGIKKGRMMTIEEADMQSANPNYQPEYIFDDEKKRLVYNPRYKEEYTINCQTCSPAYMLRLWGFDITAKGYTPESLSEYLSRQRSFEAWKNSDGSQVSPTLQKDWLNSKGYKQMTEKRWQEYFEETCKEDGVYLLTIGWKGGGGHATILQKTKQGLFYIEPQAYNPQIGAKRPIQELCKDGGRNPIPTRGILRIDNKIFDTKFSSIFEKM